MIQPDIPDNEKDRLAELIHYEILDTKPEAAFDELTKLASEICHTNISLISFVDKDRQWFKSRVGLDITQTPRDISWCGHTILGDDIFEIPDSKQDIRFKDNPLYLGKPHVTFYAGAPLITKSGNKLGTICVIDDKPRKLSEWQKSVLKRLANQVVALVEVRYKEKKLLMANERLELILESSGLGSWDWWLDEDQIYFDKRWFEMLGLPPKGKSLPFSMWESRLHPDDKDLALRELLAHVGNCSDVYEDVYRLRHENGSWVWIFASGRISEWEKDERPIRFVGTSLNITTEKITEQHLRDNQEKVHAIYEGSNDAIMMLNSEGFFDCNQKALELFAVKSKEDFAKLHPADLSPTTQPDGVSSYESAIEKIATAYKEGFNRFDWLHSRTDGTLFPAEVLLSAFNFQGKNALQATVRDISERKRLENLTTELQRMAKVGGWKFSLDYLEIHWTEEIYRIFNLKEDEQIDLHRSLSFYKKADQEKVLKLLKAASEHGISWDEEFEIVTASGESKWIRSIGEPDKNNGNKISALKGTIQDITEKKLLLANLDHERKISQHQSKLASIGQLAAGVGHEINNPLTIIKGYLNFLEGIFKKDYSQDERIFHMLEKINMATDRIGNIVRGLRTFSRTDVGDLVSFNINEAVTESINLFREIYLKDGINLELNVEVKKDLLILGNKGRIEQVIVNLISNAKDATEGQDSRQIEVLLTKEKEFVILAIRDNGKGIADDIKDKIFDPFYTTKDVNKGTGIGLSIVSSIVKEHGGEITLDTALGKGTTFNIKIPLHIPDK